MPGLRYGNFACFGALLLMAPIVSAAIGYSAPARTFSKPPANGRLDYQLGGAYPPVADVAIVIRDRLEKPAAGKYNICYVNAFQSQPGDAGWWRKNHPDLLVKKDGQYVVDPNWPDEHILDTSTSAKRAALMDVVGPWIDKCASDGFKAIEPDNLDSWMRSKGGSPGPQTLRSLSCLSNGPQSRSCDRPEECRRIGRDRRFANRFRFRDRRGMPSVV